MAGELSPDRLFYWDGQRWVSAISPDGYWRWDGAGWRQASAPGGTSSRLVWLVAAAVVLSLVVGGFGIYTMSSALLSRLFSGSNFNTACDSLQAQPGAPVAAGDDVCGGRLGIAYFSVDCMTLGGAPPPVDVWDGIGSAEPQASDVTVDSTGCGLISQPNHLLTFDTRDEIYPSAVAIADFVPVGRPRGVGIQLACTRKGSCIDFSIFNDSIYSLDERLPNDGFNNLAMGPANLFGGALKINALNRLIVRVQGQDVAVFLNGMRVAHATADRTQVAGYVTFYADNRGGRTVETVQLQRLLVFATATG